MDEVAKKRAELKNDCREWTPLDALEDLVRAIKNKEAAPSEIVIHWFEKRSDGGSQHYYQCAGVTFIAHIALLNASLKRVLEDWMD